jgi:hypothetical protein
MKLLARAIVTGFGLSVGAAIFKKVARHLRLDEKNKQDDVAASVTGRDGATDPGLRVQPS